MTWHQRPLLGILSGFSLHVLSGVAVPCEDFEWSADQNFQSDNHPSPHCTQRVVFITILYAKYLNAYDYV